MPTTLRRACRATLFTLTILAATTLHAGEVGTASPVMSYAPTFDADGVADATPELVFLDVAAGQTATAGVNPEANGGVAGGSVGFACTASPFTVIANGTRTFNGPANAASAPAITLQCTGTGVTQTGTLSCVETDLPTGITRTRTWDVVCPAAVAGTPTTTAVPTLGIGGIALGALVLLSLAAFAMHRRA